MNVTVRAGTYHPTLDEVRTLAAEAGASCPLIPVWRDVPADLETPVSAYLKIARGPYSFLLESVEGGERLARYSLIGTEPYRLLRTGPGTACPGDPLVPLRDEIDRNRALRLPGLPPFHGGAVGYLSYEVARHFERLPAPAADPLDLPEAVFMFCDTVVLFDHLRHQVRVVSHVRTDGDIAASYRQAAWKIDEQVRRLEGPVPRRLSAGPPLLHAPTAAESMGREAYELAVAGAREHIIAGDIIQVVLAQRFSQPLHVPAFEVYRALRRVNPSPYMFFLDLDGVALVGASPELLVRVEDGVVETHPIAGTRPRGATAEEDAALERELRDDPKEQAEHIMLVDLGRNDIGRVALPGTVRVTQLMEVERYSHVMHLVSHVTGQLRPELHPLDALRACFPAGTVSGAPKIRAMELIAGFEPERRGPYAGAVGYFGFAGDLDTCITIRTLLVKDGTAHWTAGAGIVYDSDPAREYRETRDKGRALQRALELAELQHDAPRPGSLGYEA